MRGRRGNFGTNLDRSRYSCGRAVPSLPRCMTSYRIQRQNSVLSMTHSHLYCSTVFVFRQRHVTLCECVSFYEIKHVFDVSDTSVVVLAAHARTRASMYMYTRNRAPLFKPLQQHAHCVYFIQPRRLVMNCLTSV